MMHGQKKQKKALVVVVVVVVRQKLLFDKSLRSKETGSDPKESIF
jgi:hypothetical protein